MAKGLDAKHAIWYVLLFGLIIRIIALYFASKSPLASDALSYHIMAEHLTRNGIFVPWFPPGLPYYISLWFSLFGISEFVSRISIIVLYAMTAGVLYLLTLKLSNRRAANIAVCIITLLPQFVLQSVDPLSQLPTALCLLSMVYLSVLLIEARSKTIVRFAVPVIGLVLGWAVLVRPSCLVLTLVVPLYLLYRTKRIWIGLLPFLIAVAILSAWLYKADKMLGRFIAINEANTANFFFGNNPYTPLYKTWWFGSHGSDTTLVPGGFTAMYDSVTSLPPKERDAAFRKIVLRHIGARPDLFVMRTASRIRTYFAFDYSTGSSLRGFYSFSTPMSLLAIAVDTLFYFLTTALVILFFATRKNYNITSNQMVLVLGIMICYSFPYWLSFSHPNYRFPIVPFLAVLAGIAADDLLRSGKASLLQVLHLPPKHRRILIAVLVLFCYIQIEWIFFNLSRI